MNSLKNWKYAVWNPQNSILMTHFSPFALAGCSVNFEFLNYTIITSKCKGPQYPPKECCGAFKEFACPYADVINDLTNECASTMFSYINLYGKYPPGLFASECREGKLGLECPALPPSVSADDTSNQFLHCPSLFLLLTTCFLIFLFWYISIPTFILCSCTIYIRALPFFVCCVWSAFWAKRIVHVPVVWGLYYIEKNYLCLVIYLLAA